MTEDGISDGDIVLIVVFPKGSPFCSQMVGEVVGVASGVNGGCYTGVASLVPTSNRSLTAAAPSGVQIGLMPAPVAANQSQVAVRVRVPEGDASRYATPIRRASLCLADYAYWSDLGTAGDVDNVSGCTSLG